MDDLRAIFLGLSDPFNGHGWFSATLLPSTRIVLRMLKVNPVVGHRPATECRPQTGDRGAVSKTGLVFDVSSTQKAHRFLEQIALLVRILARP